MKCGCESCAPEYGDLSRLAGCDAVGDKIAYFVKRMLVVFIPFAKVRHYLLRNMRSLVFIDDRGKIRRPRFMELRKVYVAQGVGCEKNFVVIKYPYSGIRVAVRFWGNYNSVVIGSRCSGTINMEFHDDNGRVEFGDEVVCINGEVHVTGGEVRVGNRCLMAGAVVFYAGDGHAILSYPQRDVLNARPGPIIIGEHCWLGREAIFLKGAMLQDDTIVGCRAVVTRSFKDGHVAIAGVPGRVVSNDVTWDEQTPGRVLKNGC